VFPGLEVGSLAECRLGSRRSRLRNDSLLWFGISNRNPLGAGLGILGRGYPAKNESCFEIRGIKPFLQKATSAGQHTTPGALPRSEILMIRCDYSRSLGSNVESSSPGIAELQGRWTGQSARLESTRLGAAKSRKRWASSEEWMFLQAANCQINPPSRQSFLS
jgi:hypothetical protein